MARSLRIVARLFIHLWLSEGFKHNWFTLPRSCGRLCCRPAGIFPRVSVRHAKNAQCRRGRRGLKLCSVFCPLCVARQQCQMHKPCVDCNSRSGHRSDSSSAPKLLHASLVAGTLLGRVVCFPRHCLPLLPHFFAYRFLKHGSKRCPANSQQEYGWFSRVVDSVLSIQVPGSRIPGRRDMSRAALIFFRCPKRPKRAISP